MKNTERLVGKIIECFEIYVKKGLFNEDFIGPDKKYYSGRRCHSRVLGILIKAFQSEGYITDVERSIRFKERYKPPERKRAMHQYRPDITIVNENDEIVGIVEYETIDAEEEHLFRKIDYFDHAIPGNPTLQFIMFFPTLTTLDRAPQKWIETDRKKYSKPILERLKKLSEKHSRIDVIYMILDENGISYKIIKDGDIQKEKDNINIWKSKDSDEKS